MAALRSATTRTIKIREEHRKLHTEHITENRRYWEAVNNSQRKPFRRRNISRPKRWWKWQKQTSWIFLALSEQDSFVGFMVVKTYNDLAYLFFLAIDPTCRSRGYGSRAIETLKAEYPGKKQVVDFEMLDDQAQNKEQRKRRRDFYLRNGYRETGVFLSYLGVDYEVFCMDRSFQEDDFKEMMKTIHIKGFSPHYFHK